MRRLLVAALVLLAPGTASAAEPSAGTAARSSPLLVWTGATTNAYFAYDAFERDAAGGCRPGTCDSFRLEVADGGADLVVHARLDGLARGGGHARGGIRITKPDGTHAWHTGESGPGTAVEAVVRSAPTGRYAIDFVDTFVGSEQTYAAAAELRFPTAAAASTHTLAMAGVAVGAFPSLNVSARFSSAAPLTAVTAVLARGGRRLATSRPRTVDGRARVVLKLKRRLDPGSYLLTVTGSDADGRPATAQAAVTVRTQ